MSFKTEKLTQEDLDFIYYENQNFEMPTLIIEKPILSQGETKTSFDEIEITISTRLSGKDLWNELGIDEVRP